MRSLTKFSLSRVNALPESLEIEGEQYRIDPCFQTVLACLRVYKDTSLDGLQQLAFLNRRFFLGKEPPNAIMHFCEFLANGEKPSVTDTKPLIDFEQDAPYIFSAFMQQYGVDLFESKMHYYKFKALLQGITDQTSLGNRIWLRGVDISKFPMERRSEILRAKMAVELESPVSEIDKQIADAIERGIDPAEVIGKG